MTRPRRAASLLAVIMLVGAGCGSAPRPPRSAPGTGSPLSLAMSVVTPAGTWAVAVMGGSVARHDDFWQLFTRPGGTRPWRLATPPGVASNGGLLAAAAAGRSLMAGFRPSQGLAFSPLAVTHDGGATWSAGLLDARLANVPGALAAAPHGGRLLALLADGTAELSAAGGTHWARLATLRSLARSAAGRVCGLQSLSAAAFSPAGVPLLAGTCRHRRTAGVFAFAGGRWRLAGPVLPPSLAGRPIRVIGLTVAGNRETVLLTAGAGPASMLLAAWSGGSGRWARSPSLPLGGAQLRSASAGPGGGIGIVLDGRAGVTLAGPGSSWRWLGFLPPATQALALGPGARVDALAAGGTTFTDWAWTARSAAWSRTQTLHVPIQYGSSG